MKNLNILLILLTLFGSLFLANAQTEKENEEVEKENLNIKKRSILLGGDSKLNFTTLKSKIDSRDISKTTNIDFSPKIGFFITDNSALGFELPFTYTSEESERNDEKYTSSSFTFAPFIRRYFGTNNIRPYLEGQIGYGHVNTEYTLPSFFNGSTSPDELSANLFLYEIEAGIGVFLNEMVSLDIALGYASTSTKFNDDNIMRIVSGFGLGVGIVIIL